MSGAPGRNRTSTVLPPPDFESGASTNSATGAARPIIAATGRGSTPIAISAHTNAGFGPLYVARSPTEQGSQTAHGRRHHQHDPFPAAGGGRDRHRGRGRGGHPGRVVL